MDLDSPLVLEEAKWFSTPNCRPLTACRVKMSLPFEQSAEATCFLQAASIPYPFLVCTNTYVLTREVCGLIMRAATQVPNRIGPYFTSSLSDRVRHWL